MAQLNLFTRLLWRQSKRGAFQSADKFGITSHVANSFKPSTYATAAAASPQRTAWAEARPFEEIPTIGGWNSIRSFLPGGKYYNLDICDMLTKMFEEYGDIILLPGTFGKPTFLMVQNPDDIATVFRQGSIWPTRIGFEILDHYRLVYNKEAFGEGSGLLTTQGKEWGAFRSAVNPVIIHPKTIKNYLPTLSKANQEFIEKIKAIRDPQTMEMPDDFNNEISSWTLESISVVALDKKLDLINGSNEEAKQFFQGLKNFFQDAVELELKISLWRLFETKSLRAAMKNLDFMTEFCEKHINEAIKKIESAKVEKPENEKSVLEKLYKIDKKVATVMAMDMLFGGVDTTTTTFTGLLLCLAKNPDKQEKLRQEVLKILPEKDSALTEENMKSLPYLRACIKESLRVYPLTTSNARSLQEDVVLSGYQVPNGVHTGLFYRNMLKDPKYFSDPEKFLPERWLRHTKGEEVCPHAPTKSHHPFVYLPFGFGARSCIGRRIAEMEIEIGACRILRNFKVEFNYPSDRPFKLIQIYVPQIPLKFKFTDLDY